MKITDDELLKLNRQGLIPGPDETEEAFLARVSYCLELQSQCASADGSGLPPCERSEECIALLAEAYPLTQSLYDIAPSWLPVAFSNYRLAPWHAGCAWIFQVDENSPTGAFLQLRKRFRGTNKGFSLCKRNELIAHEVAHVGRAMFEEPRFEELLAYRSSHLAWRRWLGPIVQTAWESGLFALILMLILMLDLFLIFTGQHATYELLFWAKLIPVAMVFAAVVRLGRRHRAFNRCLANLKLVCKKREDADALIYRLTDHEIETFATSTPEAIIAYAGESEKLSLRWRVIEAAYLKVD